MFAIWCVQWTSEGFLQSDAFSRIPTEVSITSSAGNARNSTIWSGSGSSPESLVLPLCLHDSPQFWTNSYLTNMPYDFPELYFWWCSPFPQNRHCLLTALNSTSPIPTPALFFILLLVPWALSVWATDIFPGWSFTWQLNQADAVISSTR